MASKTSDESPLVETELSRSTLFESYKNEQLPTLELNGFHFLTFRTDKIKFCFIPHEITKYVNRNIIYYMSIRFWRNKYWRLRRHTCPIDCRWQIYRLFYNDHTYTITDDNVINVLVRINKILVAWCYKQEDFRLDKYQRYLDGVVDEVELDEDDLDFFFDPDQREVILEKRNRIWHRMLPPVRPKKRVKRKH